MIKKGGDHKKVFDQIIYGSGTKETRSDEQKMNGLQQILRKKE